MNLPLYSSTLARLADGREALLSIHLATIVWDNREKLVPILASGYKPLLGTALMEGYHLEIDFELDKISRRIIVTNKYHPLEVEHRPSYPAKTQVTIPVARCDASP